MLVLEMCAFTEAVEFPYDFNEEKKEKIRRRIIYRQQKRTKREKEREVSILSFRQENRKEAIASVPFVQSSCVDSF